MAAALMKFTLDYEYSWHTPGHQGGTAFLKSPVGRIFFDYFGENMLRSDLSISVGSLGSLLDHTGPIGEHERYAARVFGAHRTYCVTNGTSMSNRVIFMAAVARDQVALCDRNCHKSIEHSLVMSGGIPNYLVPLRNRYGIIGPIPPARLKKDAIKAAIKANPLVTKGIDSRAVYAVVTNSTYDGLCYNARRVEELLDPSVDRIHFDEAWYAYARFNPLYRDRHAMHGDPKDHKGPTTFATHSTHKLLAALSQASLLHIRDGRGAIPHSRFNESFMMQASTSPLYSIIVSNDITAAMMDGPGGPTLTNESIQEAVAFRQTMGRVHRQFAEKGEWFFRTWNPDSVKHPKSGKKVPFADASPELLATEPQCWVLNPGETWHGFSDLEDDYCMLDPIKVSIVTPGVADKGGLEKRGIPASLVTKYLSSRGVEVEKTTDFTILVLFSIGITKGKWGTLLNALLEFKRDYDSNAPIEQVFPQLASSDPKVYGSIGLARSRRPDVCAAARLEADPLAGRGVLDLAEAGHDAERRVPAPRSRRDRARPARQAGQPRAGDQCRAIPARHSHAHARRVHGCERRSVPRLPEGAGVVGPALSGLWARHARHRKPRWRPVRAVPEGGFETQVSAPGRKMSLTQATMLVAGNMIGTGLFLLPVNLAQVGGIAVFGWLIATVGVAALGLVFAKLGELNPQQGGPYAYARDFLGPYAGFQTNYVYWFGNWIGNIAIAVAAVGYLAELIPAITDPPASVFATAVVIWLLTFANILGPRVVGASRPGRWRSR